MPKIEEEENGIYRTIHEDGVAVVQQYGLATTYSVRERLSSLLNTINPFSYNAKERYMVIPVQEEGQQTVFVRLKEGVGAHGQQFKMDVSSEKLDNNASERSLKTLVNGKGEFSWCIINSKNPLADNKGIGSDPLTEAREWRTVMDTALQVFATIKANIDHYTLALTY